MPLRELLDELLTSLETGPLITAVRHIEARPAVYASFPSSLDPRIIEALRARGITQLYSHQAKAFEIVATHGIRAMDAWHIATATLLLPDLAAGEPYAFASRDKEQAAVAQVRGFTLV